MTALGYFIFFAPYVLLMGLGIALPIQLDWGFGWSIGGGILGFFGGIAWDIWILSKMWDGT